MTRLHICCGATYLRGYTNIDIVGERARPGKPNPNLTTIDKYFTRPFTTVFDKRERPKYIYDLKMNILKRWKFKDNSVAEIVMISAIEHFTKKEAEFIIIEIKRVLEPGGRLIIDFPDIYEDVKQYYNRDDEWLMELIYCNQKNDLSRHKWGYTPATFAKALGAGWADIKFKTIVKHSYPMMPCIAIKA